MRSIRQKVSMGDSIPGADEQFMQGLEVLKELVERATPKKPIKHDKPDPKYRTLYSCPNCGVIYLSLHGDYCFHCGQALKWDEEEEE